MGFKMVIVLQIHSQMAPAIRAAVPDCEVQMFESAEAAMTPSWTPRRLRQHYPELLRRAANALDPGTSRAASRLLLQGTHRSNVVVTTSARSTTTTLAASCFILAFARGLHRYIRTSCSGSGGPTAWSDHAPA